MMTDNTGPHDQAKRLRYELLGNGRTEQEIAAALNCSTRKVQRLGLPFRKVGSTRIYDIEGAAALLQRRSSSETT
jgi:hypothetical protein